MNRIREILGLDPVHSRAVRSRRRIVRPFGACGDATTGDGDISAGEGNARLFALDENSWRRELTAAGRRFR